MESYQILARKYRPQTFAEVIGQKAVVQTLRNAIDSGRLAQAYIFSGMRGVGKTTVARILAKALNCELGPTSNPCNRCASCIAIREDKSVDVLEIDGASNRKVEEIGPIRDTALVKPIQSRYKVIIIDEVHMLSSTAFNALLKTLEEPPPSTIFIFATTEFHKVPLTIVSRCQHFEFKRISQKEIIDHLLAVAGKENISLSRLGAQLIAEAADGSLRDAQSLLDKAVAFCGPQVKEEDLKEILGLVPRDILFEASSIILEARAEKVFPFINKIVAQGYDLRLFYGELLRQFRNLLLVKSIERVDDLLFLTPEDIRLLQNEAEKASESDLLRYLQALLQAEAGLRYSSHPQIYLETLLVRLCHFSHLIPLKEIFRSLEDGRLTAALASSPLLSEGKPITPKPAASPAPKEKREKELPGEEEVHPPEKMMEGEKATSSPSAEELSQVEEKRPEPRPKIGAREKEQALKDPTVQTFMSFFQARVVSVEPIPRPENGEEVS